MRPRLHFTPARGWMNDPNGLVHWRGTHHLFYQYNPAGIEFANQHWGHATSHDLVTWSERETALAPGQGGTAYDETACYSGCAVEVGDELALIYTGVAGGAELPCLAYAANDALSRFVKHPGNPIITAPPEPDATAFRDHCVWRDGRRWRQLVGGGTAALGGALFHYSAATLDRWDYEGVLTSAASSGLPGLVWECPDLLLEAAAHALVVSAILDHETQVPLWAVGEVAGGEFRVSRWGALDAGDRLYAPQSFRTSDGRRVMIGWVRTHLDPARGTQPWVGAMSLPREVTVDAAGVQVAPLRELARRRRPQEQCALAAFSRAVPDGASRTGAIELDESAGSVCSALIFRDAGGAELRVATTAFRERQGPLSVYWDCGIVEVFRGGASGVWTHLGLGPLTEVAVVHPPGRAGQVTVCTMVAECDERLAGSLL